MVDIVRDIILTLAGASVLIVLHRIRRNAVRVPARVWPFLLCGFVLLFFGRVLEMFHHSTLGMPALTKIVLQELVGFIAGFIVLSIGLIRWLPPRVPRRSAAKRPASRRAAARRVEPTKTDAYASNEMLNSILKCSLSGILVLKAERDETNEIVDYECQLVNEAAEQILGRSASNLVGRRLLEEFPCIRREGLLGDSVSVIETGLPYKNVRLFKHGREGRWYQFVLVKFRDGLAVTFADVSDAKRAEEQLRHAALHDTLTGLANRALFTERIEQAVNRAKRFPEYKFAVLFLDFDRFKIINDSLGHDAGDQLLINVAERLKANLRSLDTAARSADGHLPARLGGDEFVILLEDVQGLRDAVKVAERLQLELSAPHVLCGQEVISTASIGIVSSEIGYEKADDVIRDADTAMYRAKTSGKARHVVFDEHMHEEVVNRLDLERQLREAVDRLEFSLEFEPIVHLESGALAGFEALVRWPRQEGDPVPAEELVALAEELGLIVPIGEWVLGESCRLLRSWQDRFPAQGDLRINVNLSRQQLVNPQLVPAVKRALADTGIRPGCLGLEITETMIMDDTTIFRPVLDQLKALGVELVMDDFGTGHSSLSCLHRFPITVLKIDREFVSSVRTRRDYGAIVHAVVELAHNLDMRVVAEGVESADQLALLQALDCDLAQGHIFSQALTPAQVEERLASGSAFTAAA